MIDVLKDIYEILLTRKFKDSQKVELATAKLEDTSLREKEKEKLSKMEWFSNVETVDLSRARTNEEIWNRPAKGLSIISFDGSVANTTIRFNQKHTSIYSIRVGRIKRDFGKLYLTNTAQAGKSLQFVIYLVDSADFLLTDLATDKSLLDIYTRLGVLETYQSAHYLTGVSFQTVDMPTANHEYSQALTDDKGLLRANIRDGATAYRVAWIAGKVAGPTDPYRSMVANSVYEVKAFNMNNKTLYFACGEASKKMEIEIWV